jgi:hypothetical protein
VEIKVLNGQSLFDIAIQAAGSVEAAFDIALANGVSITDELQPGTILVIPAVVNKRVADYYRSNSIKPATTLGAQDVEFVTAGINYWRIEYDFEVS